MKQRIPYILAATFCFAFAVLMVWIAGSVTFITCTRPEPVLVNCVVQDKWLGQLPVGKVKVMQDVKSVSHYVRDTEDSATFRLLLHSEVEDLEIGIFSLPNLYEAEEQLQIFLEGEDETLVIRDSVSWFAAICGGFLPLPYLFFAVLLFVNGVRKR